MIIPKQICCPVLELGSAWNLKVLQLISVNESLTHYYKHHEDYIMSFLLEDLYRAVDIFGKALKIKILHKVALKMALREKVCKLTRWQKWKHTKSSSHGNMILSSTVMLLQSNMGCLEFAIRSFIMTIKYIRFEIYLRLI